MRRVRLIFPMDKHLRSHKINDVSNWHIRKDEWAGAKPKLLLSPPNTTLEYMIKFSKQGTRRGGNELDEIRTELFNCYLGLNLGLDMAFYFPCIYRGRYGIVTKSFLKSSFELWEMKDILCRHSNTANLKEQLGRDDDVLREHNIDDIFLALEEEARVTASKKRTCTTQEKIFNSFFQMLGFDCLIG